MKTKLLRFKVQNFRSIQESDWINVDDNNCLVGTNEAGKTNLLIALWKLNPANNEPIVPLNDFPRHLFSSYKKEEHSKDIFISADFELEKAVQKQVSEQLKADLEQVKAVLVERRYDGIYYVSFPYSRIEFYPSARLLTIIDRFESSLMKYEGFLKENDELREGISVEILNIRSLINEDTFKQDLVIKIVELIEKYIAENFGRKVNLPEFFQKNFIAQLKKLNDAFEGKPVATTKEISQLILKNIPKFVYYSDYGNLDSEIFLPRVIEDFERDDLSESARAKVRTLDVLFKYVNLSPQEIYELGNDRKVIIKKVDHYNNVISIEEEDLNDSEIAEWADKKKERGVLLRSAALQLTQSFHRWWLQGDYIFSFEADGNHFRINVSDKLRPESIELEGRSRGLQWFFSFFLVFLVETKEGHSNTILLLDEPGLSLHPIAQYDLAKFFRKLSEDNQLVYTSHSPFLVDMDYLANVKVVYIDTESGRTRVTSNLRYNVKDAEKSIYPIHAALGLTVSDTLLLGCLPVLVEGPSDQIYLSLIKRFLMGQGFIQNTKEIVFIPVGGVKGMAPVTKLVSSRDDELPFVLLDSDKSGNEYVKQLKTGRYKESEGKVLQVSGFLGEKEFEIEDLMPVEGIINLVDRKYRSDIFFEDSYIKGEPIVNQIEVWAKKNNILLEDGWKVELARTFQNRFDKSMTQVNDELLNAWKDLFSTLMSSRI
jgi:predicted ATP-dependent endonuclease of OLD family